MGGDSLKKLHMRRLIVILWVEWLGVMEESGTLACVWYPKVYPRKNMQTTIIAIEINDKRGVN